MKKIVTGFNKIIVGIYFSTKILKFWLSDRHQYRESGRVALGKHLTKTIGQEQVRI